MRMNCNDVIGHMLDAIESELVNEWLEIRDYVDHALEERKESIQCVLEVLLARGCRDRESSSKMIDLQITLEMDLASFQIVTQKMAQIAAETAIAALMESIEQEA